MLILISDMMEGQTDLIWYLDEVTVLQRCTCYHPACTSANYAIRVA